MWLTKPQSMESGTLHLTIYTAKRLAQHTSLHMQHKTWVIPHSTHSTSSGSSQPQHEENKNWPTMPHTILGNCGHKLSGQHVCSCRSVFLKAYRLNGKKDDKPFLLCTVFLIFVPALCSTSSVLGTKGCQFTTTILSQRDASGLVCQCTHNSVCI
jgi:hypothetical protein